ncbi:SDR family NAD(P)-dependent oxidoreductase [Enterocloster bolteae]|uniref:SDR family NAD(P)-dependent oxidoreductase n=1 Tax=Enterocloster bolteae TaxID=208479 RepID=UPI0021086499|nr:glucose 1-dehydrogenase [Enterocloster bolteae]MCQ5145801.1 SDR family oxidoreductase [Enterocloster bolteae]
MNAEKLPFAMPSFDLNGKVAVVTGGTKGLGYGIVMVFAYHGAKVVITSRHQEDCDVVAAEVAAMGGEAMGIKADVQNVEEIQNLVDRTVEKYGRMDIMVNNAGVAVTRRLTDMTEADYERVIDSNLKSVYFGAQIAAKQMIAQGEGGKIINMCSIGGIKGNNQLSIYGASKAGAINLTKSMAWEWGRYGINVNAICPGYVKTDLNAEQLENPQFKDKVLKGIPLRRFGTVQEIAALTLFLASDCCNMLTGEYIVADMGATLGGNV